jgi:hypothetical protein
MDSTGNPYELTGLELSGAGLKIIHGGNGGQESVYEPGRFRVSSRGLFLPWTDPPARIKKVRLEWVNTPFMPRTLRAECTVVDQQPQGVEIEFDPPAPSQLRDWIARTSASLNRREVDAALRASKLYTAATIVSACGLFFGALAILMPILIGQRGWADAVSKVMLIAMVASIGGFAWIRAIAGRAELKAIRQGRD